VQPSRNKVVGSISPSRGLDGVWRARTRGLGPGRLPRLAVAAVVAGGCLIACTRRAAAQAESPAGAPGPGVGGHVYLSWVRLAGAESCPDVRQIADDVSRRLGWNPFRESPTQFIEAQIRRQPLAPRAPSPSAPQPSERPPSDQAPGSWQAEIFLRDASGASHGNRIFNSNEATCSSLAQVVALSIAIIIDPDVMLRRFSEDEFWPPSGTPAPARAVPAPSGARGALVAFGGTGLGLLPSAAPGVGLGGEVQLGAGFVARLGGFVLPEVRTPAPDENFAFGLTAGWLGACYDGIRRDSIALGACAGGVGGVMHAVVYFPDATHPGQRAFWAVTGGLRLAIHLPARVEIQLVSDGVLPLNRRQFTVVGRPAGADVVFAQPATAALLWGGLGVRFQ
jgi:hypothetical protein